MKLEVDLVRQLLLHIEEHAKRPISDLNSIKIDGWMDDQIDYLGGDQTLEWLAVLKGLSPTAGRA
jgi:hypothetical protein